MNQSDSSPLPDSRDSLRRLSVLIAVNAVDMIGFAMVLPLLPFYALKLDATEETIGWVISSFSIAQLVASPLWGRVSDRYGRRPALLVGLGASAAAYVVFGLANSVWLLFLSRVVQGLGGGTTGVAQAYVADVVPPEGRAKALGWLSAATAAGIMLGPVIGSLASHFGREVPGMVAAALCLVNVVFAWKWLPESKPEHDHDAPPRKPVWHAAWEVVRHPRTPVARMVWIYAVGMLAFTGMTSTFPLLLGARFGVNETTIGWYFLYVGAFSLVMRSLLLGPIVAKIGEVRTVRAGALFLAVGLAVFAEPRSLWVLAAVIPLVPVGTALLFPSTSALMSRFSEKSDVGTTMGVAQGFGGAARVVAPIAATILFQRLGEAWPFRVAAGIVAIVSLLAFRVKEPERLPSAPGSV